MEGHNNDFKWFGEGFDGFPKSLPDDCVEYSIYLIDSKLNSLAVREKLRQVQATATQMTRKLLKDFIWQRDSFHLNLERDAGRSMLHGKINYGDSIEDEWLIVYILRELSKQHSDVWIRIADSDGEFLLIEAANSLPLWLNPEVAEYRVWINEGRLFLIPLEKPGGTSRQKQTSDDRMDLSRALKIIGSPTAKIQHSTKIEKEAFYRLQKYPQAIADSMHHSLIKVPRKLAFILHDNPAFISPAIEAFYLRDPIALRPLNATSSSKLIFPPEDLVIISTKFNKVSFAQLASQEFPAPPSWADMSLGQGDAKAAMRAILGMKVTCGFEMLLSNPQNRDKKGYREISMLVEDVEAKSAHLPSDDDICEWGMREDDESWMDINFEDFERELTSQYMPDRDFGDKGAQENLRKIVSRFGDFINDDKAGVDGAQVMDGMDQDGMDQDDDSSEVSDSEGSGDSNEEDMDQSFDEDDFTAMIRETMGMPTDVMKEMMGKAENPQAGTQLKRSSRKEPSFDCVDDTSDASHSDDVLAQNQEYEEFHQSLEQAEQELRAAGALDLEPTNDGGLKSYPPGRAIGKRSSAMDESNTQASDEDDADHDVVDVDATLIKNLMKSFKSQGGAAGPAGNLLGLMGMQLPRDEPGGD